jgi:carbamate kinase
MAGKVVVAMRCADSPEHLPAMADAVRALLSAGQEVVLMPPGDLAGAATLAIGRTRSGQRAVPLVAHTLVDPADPAFVHLDGALDPAPLGVLEAEGIAALIGSGFPVVVAGCETVVPHGDIYQLVTAVLDPAAAAQRLAGDIGAMTLIFIVADDELVGADGPATGEIDVAEAEHRLATETVLGSELRAAVRFVRAGGELAVITTPAQSAAALDGAADGSQMLRIHRELSRPRSDAPVLAAGWC